MTKTGKCPVLLIQERLRKSKIVVTGKAWATGAINRTALAALPRPKKVQGPED